MPTNFRRVLKFASTYFSRNKGMSLAAIFVLTVTMLLATGLFYMRGIVTLLVQSIEDKIDITAYFKPTTAEQDIVNVQSQIQALPGIKSVQYVSQDQALAAFEQNHQNVPVLSKALTEVGANPFLPSL